MTMTEESIRQLQHFGYTEDEARFLNLAALHSGYFTCRQFNTYLGLERGGTSQRFIEKVVVRKHVRFERYQGQEIVYHIRCLGIYNRLGQRDNRNRREKAPFTVKRRLMGLDFILANRSCRFLAGEAEKVEHFLAQRQLEIGVLPHRHFQSHTTEQTAERFFVDKLPIFLEADSPLVHFVYVDEGAQSLEGFKTFLRQHQPLFNALGGFEVVYVAADRQWFTKAEAAFRRLFGGGPTPLELDFETHEMIGYFETRRKFETREFGGLTAARIAQYRDEKQTFAGDEFEELYRRWLDIGTASLLARDQSSSDARFRTHLLDDGYEMFGGLKHAS
jgi:hypothetical protein